ncbi:MAG: PDZ domain-containing protein [Anaerolineales bacterium]
MNKTVKILLAAMVALVLLTFVVATTAVVAYGVLKAKPALTKAFQGNEPQEVVPRVAPQVVLQADDSQIEPGVLIAAVLPESPAEDAGLVRGDILLELNGSEINTFAELTQAIAEYDPGEKVDLYVLHGDEEKTLTAELGDRGGKPYLGVRSCGCAMERDISILTTPRLGFMVAEVISGGPADQAGLKAGDHIVKLDGQELERGANLADLIAEKQPGDKIVLEVIKPGQEPRQVSVTLGKHPEKEGVAYLGIRFMPPPIFRPNMEGITPPDGTFPHLPNEDFMHPFEGDHFEMPEGVHHGAVIAEVFPETAAEAAGLQQGDVITALDGEEVATMEEVIEAIQNKSPGDEMKVTILRRGESESQTIGVVLGEHPDKEGVAFLGVNLGQMIRHEFHHDGELPEGLPFFKDFFENLPSFELPFSGEEL